jgi:hypothetical protein
MKQGLLLGVGLVLHIAATGSASAQSTDRNRPTPLTSNELSGELQGNGGRSSGNRFGGGNRGDYGRSSRH